MRRSPAGLRETARERRNRRERALFKLVSRTGARVVKAEALRNSPRRALAALPSLFTLANMLCGFAAILTSINGDHRSAAIFVGLSIGLDICDGAVARAVDSVTPFGLQLDSLADLISFGMAPAILMFGWALGDSHPLGWLACFAWLACAAIRLARFNVTVDPIADKRFFIGLPSPGAAGVVIATVFAFPGPDSTGGRVGALLVVLVPALLMVSSFRFRTFRSLVTPRHSRNYQLVAVGIALAIGFSTVPRVTGCVLAYGYLCLPLLGWLTAPVRRRILGPPRPVLTDASAEPTDIADVTDVR